ncbi:MAG: hypothetical protein AAFY57_15335 [Cyanobacteria bacterium J06642_2]
MTTMTNPEVENGLTGNEDRLPNRVRSAIATIVHDVEDTSRQAIVNRSWNTADRLEERKRPLHALSREAIYMLQIGIHLGGNSVCLDYRQLGLDPDVAAALSRAGAATPTIPIFKKLRHFGNKLSGDRKRLQDRRLVYGDPWWFFPEAKCPEVAESVEDLFATYDQYQQNVTDDDTYRDGYRDYLETIEKS